MGKIILVTGGARSGKSTFAENLVSRLGTKILYIATSIPFDDEMKDRIRKHREQRPSFWDTLEAYKNLDIKIKEIYKGHQGILLDCITIMISNILFSNGDIDWNTCNMDKVNGLELQVKEEINKLIKVSGEINVPVVVVTNELGMGIVPENRLARIFRDIAGRVNQQLAAAAEEVYLVVAGIPVRIK
ncbi:MAG: adenosylcobinamide kinase / adenosylcobinamide-phosphate guanylyltransferase [Petroclostridium sp.]|uniref:bifunctional adenosylcobinamide kinase/adenosylcobinamide-phosphate guanylyltransferase n=1 Tax=Petroclostridium xylanilyticum TaxID=1792311 RepID=UPI000B99BDD5|nr:bifunctional adenosylcobinamide kinase/adenosylcobinamide-phosphate guanylyltransferase [Petroclostridium xylanilyticum]MDK2810557.1 adenosylcobinamide kinase / adenosylcobinamide-phosphate guanylyltransferase [Petroclostridium sp.]